MHHIVNEDTACRVLGAMLECCEHDGECLLELRFTGTRYVASIRDPDCPDPHSTGKGNTPAEALDNLAAVLLEGPQD